MEKKNDYARIGEEAGVRSQESEDRGEQKTLTLALSQRERGGGCDP